MQISLGNGKKHSWSLRLDPTLSVQSDVTLNVTDLGNNDSSTVI